MHIKAGVVTVGTVATATGLGLAVEWDGPWCFQGQPGAGAGAGAGAALRPTDSTLQRNRLLQSEEAGFSALITVPFWSWEACKGSAELEEALLTSLLVQAGV